ncbi:MAG: hypothetical protein KDC90_19210 [Ignavibacteriae bacterium]|nr:hypothetical protein [Ignavibacteriota bacterium]
MYEFVKSISELLIFVLGILVIISSRSKKQKLSEGNKHEIRLLIYGILIVLLSIIISFPEMYNGFIEGWNTNK